MIVHMRAGMNPAPCARSGIKYRAPQLSRLATPNRPRRRRPVPWPALTLLGVILAETLAAAPPAYPARGKPPHVGVVHPSPRFCRGQEHSQRDLRLLRLAFRITLRISGAAALPWFYKTYQGRGAGQNTILLALDTMALWNTPLSALADYNPEGLESAPGQTGPDPLQPWRSGTISRIPDLAESSLPSLAQFEAPSPSKRPFWFSRLGGSAVLPYYSAVTEAPADSCVRWPLGTIYEAAKTAKTARTKQIDKPGKARAGYKLHYRGEAGGFRISAYASLKSMFRDLQWGRLQAVLLDGGELAAALESSLKLPQPLVGGSPGTQQLVLRPRPGLGDEMGPDAMRILSKAIARKRLARAAGPGYAPSQGFIPFAPNAPKTKRDDFLVWDARTARGDWLKLDNPPRKLSLAVLRHPVLKRVAQGLASQWKKSLSLEITVVLLSVEKFDQPGGADEADFNLLVVDLDNGSLQDLWRAALQVTTEAPVERSSQVSAETSMAGFATLLRRDLPYLPLIQNAHYLLASSPAAYRRAAHLCPGCVVAPLESHRIRGRP